MEFDFFLNNRSKIEKIKVKAALAHKAFSPEGRPQFSTTYKTEKTRKAGVMVILSPVNGEVHVTFILRTTYKGAHSGQISFAGGKREEEDSSFLDTAYREVEEEIGISKNQLIYCRDLTSIYIPPSDFRVYPFLAYATEPLAYKIQELEVAEVISIPLKTLLCEKNQKRIHVKVENNKFIIVPAFIYNNYKIWGATAMILNELIVVILKSMH